MEPQLEEELLEELRGKHLSDVPACPVASFDDLRRRVDAGELFLAVDYSAANQLAHSLFGVSGSLIAGLISWIPFLVAVACLPTAYLVGNFWVLAGVPLALVAMFFSNPMNPARLFATFTGIVAAAGGAWFWSQSAAAPAALCISYAVSFWAIRFLYFRNSQKLTRAALHSEPLLLYLLEAGHLLIRNTKTGELWGKLS